jgi:hypothetical protein
VPSRAIDASIWVMLALRDSPEPPGLSSILKKTFVARTMLSRLAYFRIARPVISSELP